MKRDIVKSQFGKDKVKIRLGHRSEKTKESIKYSTIYFQRLPFPILNEAVVDIQCLKALNGVSLSASPIQFLFLNNSTTR